MNETKHTPGPWMAKERELGRRWDIDNSKGQAIATLCNYGTAEKLNATCFRDELKDNARLIAAAPDLLETCEKLRGIAPQLWGDNPEKWPKIMDRVENSISKATK